MAENGDGDSGIPSKKAKLFAAPTIEEISDLRESEGLYSGRLSQLKVAEIIKEISPTPADLKDANELVRRIRDKFKKLESLDDLDLENGEKCPLPVPIRFAPPSRKGKMKFRAPKGLNLAHWNETIKYGERIRLHLEVIVPTEIFQDKDHWDERYIFASFFNLLKDSKENFSNEKKFLLDITESGPFIWLIWPVPWQANST